MCTEEYKKNFADAKYDTKLEKGACDLLTSIMSCHLLISFMTTY